LNGSTRKPSDDSLLLPHVPECGYAQDYFLLLDNETVPHGREW